jgi:hypothetical protein
MSACRAVLIIVMGFMFFFSPALTAYGISEETEPADEISSFTRLQAPFVTNKGQIANKEVAYFAKLINGYIHIDKNGAVIYNYNLRDKKAIVIKEIFTEKKIAIAALEPPSEEVVAVLRNRGQITGEISNYFRLSYGAIHKGIELQLLAFTDNLEKIFTISPGGDPGSIAVKLKDVEELKVNDAGELEILTKQGPVNFSPPHAYQFVGEKRKPVDVAYTVRTDTTYGFKLGSYDKTQPLFIAPIIPAFLLSAP